MTATLSCHGRAQCRRYTVQRLRDPQQARPLLEQDRPYAAYAIAQLEPRRFIYCDWYTAVGPSGQALLLHSRGGLGQALFAIGDPTALDAALSLHPGPRFTFGSIRLKHRPVVESYFLLTRRQQMLRMSVTRQGFQPANGPALRLFGRDIAAINRLYSAESGPASYRPQHIDEGVYFGALEDGRLVAIAGTHVVSAAEGVAVVGNVFTHPRYRGRGLATIVTSAVTAELLQTCPLVVLTVDAANEPAVKAYRRLGYETHCTLHESPLIRREPFGVLSLARRFAAAWRGRDQDTEVVIR